MSERKSEITREVTFDLAARADGSDLIPVVISSDAVVMMQDGPEILLHTREAVDLRRAPLPIIATHGSGQVNVGLIDDLRIEGGKMRGMARFGKRPEARGYEEDVLSGVIRSVSAGYSRMHATIRRDGVLVTDRWMPSHVAMVAEPADINAGFYRSAGEPAEAFVIEQEQEAATQIAAEAAAVRDAVTTPAGIPAEPKGRQMSEAATAPAGAPPAEPKQPVGNAVEIEGARVKAITNLAKACNADDRFVRHWISTGASVETVSEELMKVVETRSQSAPTSPAMLGMERKEVENWSLFRAMRALDSGDWEKAGLELAASKAVQERTQIAPRSKHSILVPLDVLARSMQINAMRQAAARRDLTAASGPAGGYLVETENQGFVELLRNASVCYAMGATRLSGLQGNVTIPKRTAGATGYWLATESTAITESNQTFGQIAMSPKTCGAYNEISRQLMMQSSPAAEDLVMSGLALDVGTAVDLAGLNGSGAAGQPLGVIGTSGIGTTASLATLAYTQIMEFQTDVAAANALGGNLGYVTTPTVAGLGKIRVKYTSTASPLWEGRLERGLIDGYPAMSSNQMPAGNILYGDWSQLVIGEWGVLEIAVNQQANFPAGIIGVRALYSVDVAVRIPGAFSLGTGAT
jgi:HK97 family phage major capsid protein